jgi:hypothetical protein
VYKLRITGRLKGGYKDRSMDGRTDDRQVDDCLDEWLNCRRSSIIMAKELF